MQSARHLILCACALGTVAIACRPKATGEVDRARLAEALRDSLGRRAHPHVTFMNDGGRQNSHLYLAFDTIVPPTVSNAAFEVRARDLARFALRHYAHAEKLDSITVASREPLQPSIWRIHHLHTFSTARLALASTPPE